MRLTKIFGISFLLFTLNLSGQIEFVDIENIVLFEESAILDINNDSNNDFEIHYFYETDPNGYAFGYNVIPLDSNAVLANGYGSIVEKQLNDTIHQNLEDWMTFFPGPSYWIRRFVSYDNSLNIRVNEFTYLFMGIRLKVDTSYYYGWIQFSGLEYANNLTIESFAYNQSPYQIAVISDSLYTAVNENYLENSIIIYPNPATTNIMIRIDNSDITKIEIFNQVGQIVKNANFIDKINISTNDLNSGIYIAKIENNNYSISRKIIIEQ